MRVRFPSHSPLLYAQGEVRGGSITEPPPISLYVNAKMRIYYSVNRNITGESCSVGSLGESQMASASNWKGGCISARPFCYATADYVAASLPAFQAARR